MRFEIWVNDQRLMAVRYVSDAEWFIQDRRSVGQRVRVHDLVTRKWYETETVEAIIDDVTAHPVQA